MKNFTSIKNLFLLLLITVTLSCNSDDKLTDEKSLVLKKASTVVHLINSQETFLREYNFDDNKALNVIRTSSEFDGSEEIIKLEKYVYNNEEKIQKLSRVDNSNDVWATYTFDYDSSGKIISIDEDYPNGLPNENGESSPFPKNFSRNISYIGNSIKTTFPLTLTTNYEIEYILNQQGLIEEYIQSFPNGNIWIKLVFNYDINQNCTSVISTRVNRLDPSGGLITETINYSYDDKKNPFFPIFDKNYLSYLLIHGRIPYSRSSQFIPLIYEISKFGKNNKLLSTNNMLSNLSRESCNEYEYNTEEYPSISISRINSIFNSDDDKTISSETDFFYKE